MKILFCLFARLGDVCCGIPAFLALREKYPKAELTWATLAQYQPLIPKCGTVRPFGSPPYGSMPHWASQPEYDIVIKAQPMWRHREWEQSKTHAVDLICKWAGVTPKVKSIVIETTDENNAAAMKIAPKQPFVTICSSPCYSCGNWPMPMRQTMVDHFRKRGISVITVGGHDGQPLKGAETGHGRLSYAETLALINHSRLYIGPDTGVTWLACAAKKAAKLCLIDRNRLNQGKVGFKVTLSDANIVDSFYQDGVNKHIQLADELWNKS